MSAPLAWPPEEELRLIVCRCYGWAWAPAHLRQGVQRAPDGSRHHPSHRCNGEMIGCDGSEPFGARCSTHGATKRHK